MASFSAIKDVSMPIDTSSWLPNRKQTPLTKEQSAVLANFKALESKQDCKVPVEMDVELDTAIQESMPWKEVRRKKEQTIEIEATNNESKHRIIDLSEQESRDLEMKKVKVTFAIRVPKDTDGFSPAKLHLDALHEIHKFDESLMVFNHKGDAKINVESPMSDTQYKETFQPFEKRVGRNPGWISISHDIILTTKAADCKEHIFPYLKKNKIFMYINPKPGLEHFAAIGVLFGPNPDFTWRDELATLLIETMKTVITDEEKVILGETRERNPKIILSLNIQAIGNSTPTPTTSIALEIRVPSGQERIYISILERLYEKAQEETIIIPTKLGKFFPYYMKSKKPEVFNFLMRQQNADMASTTIIPIFGYTPEVRQQSITIDGEQTTVELAMATTENIIRIEATPSTWNLHKYLVIVTTDKKESVTKEIRRIFGQITATLKNQPPNFPIPRCGGSEKISGTGPNSTEDQFEKQSTAYMTSLETLVSAQNPQDAGPASPPQRHRKFTISYASAVKTGILKKSEQQGTLPFSQKSTTGTITMETNTQLSEFSNSRQVSWDENISDTSRLTGSSLSRSMTNSKLQSLKKDFDAELKEIKNNLERRMEKQEEQMSDLVNVIKTMNDDMERRMAHAVLQVIIKEKEKEKVQELTHGRTYPAKEAPLADEEGNLPYGGKVQLGGPLHRLHHVEVTIQQMSTALDAILSHMQKDPTAKYLFREDDDSDTPTISANQVKTQQSSPENNIDQQSLDVQMPMRDFSGSKRQLSENSPSKNRHGPDPKPSSSPQRSPPPKKERSYITQPPADPDDPDNITRERGQP
jgi:hypothetical protein